MSLPFSGGNARVSSDEMREANGGRLSSFAICLTDRERASLARMPDYFQKDPCEEHLAEAYAFWKNSGTPVGQRYVARRWIADHLRNVDAALSPLPWADHPAASAHYAQELQLTPAELAGTYPSAGAGARFARLGSSRSHEDSLATELMQAVNTELERMAAALTGTADTAEDVNPGTRAEAPEMGPNERLARTLLVD